MKVFTMFRQARTSSDGVVALCFVLLIALLLSPMHISAAQGDTRSIDPDMIFSIEIHKYEQPVTLGVVADGLPMDTSDLTPVPGATYTAKRVPGIDPTTNSGQREAARLSASEAAERTAGTAATASAVTDVNGNATLADLGVGLYYVQETTIPAGYAGATPFVVALPMTHPQQRDAWLSTVHVYPKSAKVGIDLEVIDQDAVKVGDTVRWVSRSSIPFQSSISGYRVDQIINPNLRLIGAPGHEVDDVTVTVEGAEVGTRTQIRFASYTNTVNSAPGLIAGLDYEISYSAADRTITLLFLAPGLRKLESAIANDPGAQVLMEYETTVEAEGIHNNDAVLYPSRYAIDNGVGVREGATTKWGPLSVIVSENSNPINPISGAKFELYATPQDAFARRNSVTINGVSQWGTNEQGRLVVNGLRFSEFVNGLDREASDPLFRDYWVVPVSLPEGWAWVDQQPMNATVNSELEYQTLVYLAEQKPDGSDPGDRSKRTGLIFGWIPIFWDFGGSSDTSSDGGSGDDSADTGANSAASGIQSEGGGIFSIGRDNLASTGAQVTGLVMFGLVLMIAGTFLVVGRRGKKKDGVKP